MWCKEGKPNSKTMQGGKGAMRKGRRGVKTEWTNPATSFQKCPSQAHVSLAEKQSHNEDSL